MIGTGVLVRLALRRDRLLLPVWILVIVAIPVAIASAIAELYPDVGQRLALGATMMANPALQALTGPIFDPASVGGLTAWRATTFAAVLAGLMSIMLVTRHTRAEEESGRAELIGAAPVGRYALPAAAVIVTGLANLLAALLLVAGLAGQGLPLAGSIAFAGAVAGMGLVFTGIAAVTAQLTANARTANALAVAVLGLFFLLRSAGDASGAEAVSWLSPLGWAQRIRAFADERWWLLAVFAAVAVLLVAGADLLARRRDIGAGLLAARRGPAAASASLRSPLALAWRLQRGMLFGWAAGFAVVGGVFGALAASVGDIVGDIPQIADMLARIGGAGVLVDTFFATQLGLFALVASGYAVQAASRPRAEETIGRAEPVLAASVPRWRWLAGHVACALAGSALILLIAGLAAGLAHGLRIGEPATQATRIAGAALAQVPAVWVLAGITVLLFGLLPRMTAVAWAFLVAFFLLGQLGELLQIDETIRRFSPFAHVPALPGGTATATPFVWLCLTTGVLIAAGVAGFGHRDLKSD
ncbi:ABC transporter membrane-spanning protein [Acrocarpospora macrocephala]|uniref:ABC transporter membrane-spanning protein n=1 Tax=Acrocarpospora macrocephala TaxID=150177 RepID=A0A5M3WLC2_9ACTN|nr:ABC transporter permease [Acrocarpospora macrocephala]GES08959.1 ABC transporter membrane-spanning protein [Acrocarpospora macrocephala]